MNTVPDVAMLIAVLTLYFAISIQIFDSIYNASQIIIDEVFHIPQGMQFCALNFSKWDDKITTLPGLYIISTFMILPIHECSPYLLRMTNFLASGFNIYLFFAILMRIHGRKTLNPTIVAQVINLIFLPPLYFFAHVYYTDMLSLTFVLLFYKHYLDRDFFTMILSGALAILVRQTNVLWIAFCLGNTLFNLLVSSYVDIKNPQKNVSLFKPKNRYMKLAKELKKDNDFDVRFYSLEHIYSAVKFHYQTRLKFIFEYINCESVCEILSMLILLISFVAFVIVNGSIVVGDKSAHTASLHIPQLFYFTSFYGVFSFPYILRNLPAVLYNMYRHKLLVLFLIAISIFIVQYNSLVHPYLLADNRHYTFYIWNRFYGRYWFARFILIPAYVFLGFSILENLKGNSNAGFIISFCICLFFSVALQKMIEVRYFLIPYIMLKMKFYHPSWLTLVLDFAINIAVNYFTLDIFFSKEIVWDDFEDVQRIIW